MTKKRKKTPANQFSSNVLDKLLEQTFALILSFVFTTALIGGCTYALFQYPRELDEINKEYVEFDKIINDMNNYNEMVDVQTTGWLADSNAKVEFNEIIATIAANGTDKNLDVMFVNDSIKWITNAMVIVSRERGKISGYLLEGDLENDLQRNFIREYDYWMSSLSEIEVMLRNWNKETASQRDKRLASLQSLTVNSMSNLSEINSIVSQMRSNIDLKSKTYAQKFRELHTKRNIARIKFFLSGIGVVTGLTLLVVLGKSTYKKFATN